MAESKKRIVRKGRIYQVQVADVEYRAFIWQDGSMFSGRVEDYPQITSSRGRSVVAVREQLSALLATRLAS